MARHYTDAIGEEDRRAAEHIGRVLDEVTTDRPWRARAPLTSLDRAVLQTWRGRDDLGIQETFHRAPRDLIATCHPVSLTTRIGPPRCHDLWTTFASALADRW
jgi:hypothetical protein